MSRTAAIRVFVVVVTIIMSSSLAIGGAPSFLSEAGINSAGESVTGEVDRNPGNGPLAKGERQPEPTDTLVFLHIGEGSGTLNGVPFGPAPFVIAALGSRQYRRDVSGVNVWLIPHQAASITIAGVGTSHFLIPTETWVNNDTGFCGFGWDDPVGATLTYGPMDAALATWDMSTGIGPIDGDISLTQWAFSPVDTSNGVLEFTNSTAAGSFQAVVADRAFIHMGEGSGTLDGAAFGSGTPAPFVVAGAGSGAYREYLGIGWYIPHSAATITIAGVGVTHFISGTTTFVNTSIYTVGLARYPSPSDLFVGPSSLPDFQPWDMMATVGPVSGAGTLMQWSDTDFITTGGVLVFDDGGGSAEFTSLSDVVFADGFESGGVSAWSSSMP